MGIIFANMHDASISEMTELRSMAALPFGGRYRLVDFPLTALYNAAITQVGIVVKENYHSLMDHIGTGRDWDLARKNGGVSIFPPFSEAGFGDSVYHGRIEAMRSVYNYINDSQAKYVVLMDCDHVCNLDLEDIVNTHIDGGYDATIACCDLPDHMQNTGSCVAVAADGDGRVTAINRNSPREQGDCYSMNLFVLAKPLLLQLLDSAPYGSAAHFEADVLAPLLGQLNVHCYHYDGFVRRIYSVKSYYDASMSLLEAHNMDGLFFSRGPVYTKVFDAAPVRYGLESAVENTLAADGCIIEGHVENSLLFRNVKIEPGAEVRNSILMQDTVVKSGARLDYVITDKAVVVGSSHQLSGGPDDPMYIKKLSEV